MEPMVSKHHLAVDTDTHEIIAADMTLSGVTDAEVLPNLLKHAEPSRKFREMEYTMQGRATGRLGLSKRFLYPSCEGGGPSEKMGIHAIWRLAARNPMGRAISGKYGYHRRSLSEAVMSRVK